MSYRYDVSVIIVNYNGRQYLDNVLQSLSEVSNRTLTFEVILVDNNSTDDSVELAGKYKEKIRNLKILPTGKNLGFAGGNNFGAKHSEGEFLVFLNNDTKVDKDWLWELYNVCKNPIVGAASSKLLFFYDYIKVETRTIDKVLLNSTIRLNGKEVAVDPKFCKNLLHYQDHMVCFGHSSFYIPLIDGEKDYDIEIEVISSTGVDRIVFGENETEITSSGNVNIKIKQEYISSNKKTLIQNAGSGIDENFNGYDIGFCEEDNGQFDEIAKINNACGASMMIRKSDFDLLGGFDEYFFMYYEDTDLSYKVKELGKEIYYVPGSVVRHIHTGSSKEWSPFFIYHVFRNRLLFILRHYPLRVYWHQFMKYVYSVLRSVAGNDKLEIKKAKVKALLSVIKRTPYYYYLKRFEKGKSRRRVFDA